MSRIMRDSTDVHAIPRRTRIVAAYVNGRYANVDEARRMFDHVETVAVSGPVRARFYDVENGDYEPGSPDLISNLKADRSRNYLSYVYCSLSNWSNVKEALRVHGLLEWMGERYWIAYYQFPANPRFIPKGASICQYHGSPGNWDKHYDESVMRFYCPGIDSPKGFRAIIHRLRQRVKRLTK